MGREHFHPSLLWISNKSKQLGVQHCQKKLNPMAPELTSPLETQQQKDGDVREEQSAVKYEKLTTSKPTAAGSKVIIPLPLN